MKNIQIIDGAVNCVYDVFAVPDEVFEQIFNPGTDVAFSEDLTEPAAAALAGCWRNRVPKAEIQGIHGTLFYGMPWKRQFYPTKRDAEAVNPDGSRLRARTAG